MALVLYGGGVAQASGSIGGTTFSRNAAGAYMRTRAIPVDPASQQQQVVRSALATLTSRWVDTLTPAQRNAWKAYSDNVPIVGPLGNARTVGALAMYVRSNTPRIQAGFSVVDDAPVIFDLGEYTLPTIEGMAITTDVISVGFDNTDAWANETGSAMLVYNSAGQNLSVNFFKGPYRLAGSIDGDDSTAPTSPAVVTSQFPFVAGQINFVRFRVTRVDGRLSSSFRAFGIPA